ncbi:hypothetical protein ACEN9X_09745 [Mucilaginibacter sp. Mucisp86]
MQKSNTDRPLLKSLIRLRLAIIFFFMCGPFRGVTCSVPAKYQ